MRYLSFDLEATGLEEDALIIEFAMVPIDADELKVESALSKHFYIKCPSFSKLESKLNPWVREHNKTLIEVAHKEGIELPNFKQQLESYLESPQIKEYFKHEKVRLFGKSINAIDLPFMNRDLGWEWMNKYFHHRCLDLSCFAMGLIDAGLLKAGLDSGSKMMESFGMGEVSHTALEDAVNTAKMYFKILEQIKSSSVTS